MSSQLLAAADTVLMAAPVNLSSTKDWILAAAGTVVIIILIVRIVMAYGRKQWGEMVTEMLGGAFVLWFCFFNDNAIQTLKTIAQAIFG